MKHTRIIQIIGYSFLAVVFVFSVVGFNVNAFAGDKAVRKKPY